MPDKRPTFLDGREDRPSVQRHEEPSPPRSDDDEELFDHAFRSYLESRAKGPERPSDDEDAPDSSHLFLRKTVHLGEDLRERVTVDPIPLADQIDEAVEEEHDDGLVGFGQEGYREPERSARPRKTGRLLTSAVGGGLTLALLAVIAYPDHPVVAPLNHTLNDYAQRAWRSLTWGPAAPVEGPVSEREDEEESGLEAFDPDAFARVQEEAEEQQRLLALQQRRREPEAEAAAEPEVLPLPSVGSTEPKGTKREILSSDGIAKYWVGPSKPEKRDAAPREAATTIPAPAQPAVAPEEIRKPERLQVIKPEINSDTPAKLPQKSAPLPRAPEAPKSPAGPQGRPVIVQVAAVDNKPAAQKLVDQLGTHGIPAEVREVAVNGKTYHRVVVPVSGRPDGQKVVEKIMAAGIVKDKPFVREVQ